MYPSFTGNTFTSHRQEGKILAKQQLRLSGWHIEDEGTIVFFEEPWLSVSPHKIITNAEGSKWLLKLDVQYLKITRNLTAYYNW